jgi:hypothetical protein
LWFFSVPPTPIPPTPSNTALSSLRCLPQARFVSYLPRCFGSPSLSTFLRALSRGYIHGIPQLTPTLVRKFPPLSLATAFGHLDQLRQGVASSRKIHPPSCLAAPLLSLPSPPHPTSSHHNLIILIAPPPRPRHAAGGFPGGGQCGGGGVAEGAGAFAAGT